MIWLRTIAVSCIMTLALSPVMTARADTGLDFPRNDQVSNGQTVRFKFVNPHLNGLPIYGPGGAGLTYIFKVRPRQQTGYYPTPTDISDKSGAGHNPSWVGSNRPRCIATGASISRRRPSRKDSC